MLRQLLLASAVVAAGCSGSDADEALPDSPGGWHAQAGAAGASGSVLGHDAGAAEGGSEQCGNGLDDDGDLDIDEGCACEAGKVQACYDGAVSIAGVGACRKGTQQCEVSGSGENKTSHWGPCIGSVDPSVEECDGVDNDCDGVIDDGCSCKDGDTLPCATACGTGEQVCASGAWGACDAPLAGSEVCGDGIDQDCDGADLTCPGSCTDGVQNQGETSVDCGGPCGSREAEVTFEMTHENTWSAGCAGTERIVSVENTGGSWCAWESSPDCPLACPSATIQADQKSILVGGDTKWDDNSGSCSYRVHICGKP